MDPSSNNIFYFGDEKMPELKRGKKERIKWVEDSFLFEEATGKQVASSKSTRYVGSSFSKKSSYFFITIILFLFGIILTKVIYLQILNGSHYAGLAEQNRERHIPIKSERGIIYDTNNFQLTKNIPNFSLTLIPQDLPKGRGDETRKKREEIIDDLAKITKKDRIEIEETLKKYGSYSYESIVIEEDLDYETALSIQIASADLPGINIERGSKRLYIHPDVEIVSSTTSTVIYSSTSSLSHVLGYLGKLNPDELGILYEDGYLPSDSIGKIGLEKQYEQDLRGIYGEKRIEVNALGKEQSVLSEAAPIPGKHLRLSIDSTMQVALEQILEETLLKEEKHKAIAIAMDPKNGNILAMVSLPTFDNNDFSGGIDSKKYSEYINNPHRPLFNRAIAGTYPSGSTIKPAVSLAALQEGLISPVTTFISNGGIQVGQWFFPDWQSGGHGPTNVRKSLAWSVNTFYYYLGGGYRDFVGLGVDTITKYLRQFGLHAQLGIDLPGEQLGFLPSKDWKEEVKGERWYVGDTYNLSIGQGDLLVTPLQVASMTSVVANGGKLYEPHVVSALINPLTKEEKLLAPKILRENFISRDHINTVQAGMRDCVVYGSCRRLATLPVSVAGKTGTAQWSSLHDNHAWFTSFAPYEDPEIIFTVLIEEGGEGSGVAVPVAEKFYRWWWNYRNS